MEELINCDDSIDVYDFFSGCGGTSAGLREAGMNIKLGLDFDKHAAKTFRRNFPEAAFLCRDIKSLKVEDLEEYIDKNPNRKRKILFTGCAPCQPFSVLNRWNKRVEDPTADEKELKRRAKRDKEHKEKESLLLEFIKFIEYYLPDFVFVENVPGFQKLSDDYAPFSELLSVLDRLGYHYPDPKIIEMHRYGVPQRRRRIVLIASRLGPIDYPEETHNGKEIPFVTVYDRIGGDKALPEIAAGECHSEIPNHQSPRLSPLNLERIKEIPAGKNRLVLPEHLRLACHRNRDAVHTDVYGRLFWNEPATGLTTRCTSLSNGRFGHPDQHRAISAREAARLQTFADTFVFEGGINAISRQIGNAVPVELAQRFGEKFDEHLKEYILKILINSNG